MSNLLLEKSLDSAPQTQSFNSLTPDQLAKLETAFWSDDHIKQARKLSQAAGAGAIAISIVGAGSAFAQTGTAGTDAAANAKTVIEGGVANAIGMIRAIDGIGLAAFGVALAPMGFMVTLRVLNMVLSRV